MNWFFGIPGFCLKLAISKVVLAELMNWHSTTGDAMFSTARTPAPGYRSRVRHRALNISTG
jgi:hypothetical protein